MKEEQKAKKDTKKKEQDELNQLFKPVVELQKCGKGEWRCCFRFRFQKSLQRVSHRFDGSLFWQRLSRQGN